MSSQNPKPSLYSTARSAGLALAMVMALVVACHGEGVSPLRGAKLGMSLRDVRARFETPEMTEGAWKVESDPTPTMTYAASRGSLRNATFEFHSGMLVAATVLVDASDPSAKGPALSVTDTTITARTPQGDLTSVRVIARDCPGHQEEIKKLLTGRAK